MSSISPQFFHPRHLQSDIAEMSQGDMKKALKAARTAVFQRLYCGRGERIRTFDPLLPKQVR